jgi:hypothetical protein
MKFMPPSLPSWAKLAALLLCAVLPGCSSGDKTSPPSGGVSPAGTSSYPSSADACVNKINQYRASANLPPYVRWTDQEGCADGQARRDSESGQAHGAFQACGELAQNECPGFPSLDEIISSCLDMMWQEGPGDFSAHGHYLNMSSTQYSRAACGFYVTPGGKVWAVQDFR